MVRTKKRKDQIPSVDTAARAAAPTPTPAPTNNRSKDNVKRTEKRDDSKEKKPKRKRRRKARVLGMYFSAMDGWDRDRLVLMLGEGSGF